MIDNVVKIIRGIVRVRGNTDNTLIGNISDALKVTLQPTAVSAGNTTTTNLSAATLVTTGNITAGSNQLTGLASTTGLANGQLITILNGSVPAVPSGTTISSIAGSTVTMSAVANPLATITGASVTFSAAGQFFTGTWEDVKNYPEMDINVIGGAAATASGTLFFEFSPDNGTNVDVSVPIVVTDIRVGLIPIPLRSILPYFRIRYVNGAVSQTALRLTVQYHRTPATRLTRFLGQSSTIAEPIQGVVAAMQGFDPSTGTYPDLTTTLVGTNQSVDVNVVQTVTRGPLTASSPTVASVGTSSAQAVASNANRKGLVLTNTSISKISFGLGATAVLGSGITLYPGGVWVMDTFNYTTAAINAIAGAAASGLSIQEFT